MWRAAVTGSRLRGEARINGATAAIVTAGDTTLAIVEIPREKQVAGASLPTPP